MFLSSLALRLPRLRHLCYTAACLAPHPHLITALLAISAALASRRTAARLSAIEGWT